MWYSMLPIVLLHISTKCFYVDPWAFSQLVPLLPVLSLQVCLLALAISDQSIWIWSDPCCFNCFGPFYVVYTGLELVIRYFSRPLYVEKFSEQSSLICIYLTFHCFICCPEMWVVKHYRGYQGIEYSDFSGNWHVTVFHTGSYVFMLFMANVFLRLKSSVVSRSEPRYWQFLYVLSLPLIMLYVSIFDSLQVRFLFIRSCGNMDCWYCIALLSLLINTYPIISSAYWSGMIRDCRCIS